MSNSIQALHELIENKSATIGIIGMGYVGLPLALRYTSVGYRVIGFDIDTGRIEKLNSGKSYITHISDIRIRVALEMKFIATGDFSLAESCDALIICVPTPLNGDSEPDLSHILDSASSIKPYLRTGQIISLESTTYPGTTEEILAPIVQDNSELYIGENIFLVYSPEREDPGNEDICVNSIPKIIGGYTPACLRIGSFLYEKIVEKVVPVSSTRAAEMTKLLENIYRSVNIALINEIKLITASMDIDIFEIIDAAATKPFGFLPHYPGPGVGGHCIPVDPAFFNWKAKRYGSSSRLIELSTSINMEMPVHIVNNLILSLIKNNLFLRDSSILIIGITYKKNIDDLRNSPALQIIKILLEKGARISYSDPYIPEVLICESMTSTLFSIDLTPQSISSFDAVVLVTDHDVFDYQLIYNYASLIIDTRGKFNFADDTVINT